jgi:hypothetical protein
MLSIIIEAGYFKQVSASAQSETMLEAKNYRDEVNYQISDLLYLSDIVRNARYMSEGDDIKFLQTIQSAFSDFSRSNASFDQVRLFGRMVWNLFVSTGSMVKRTSYQKMNYRKRATVIFQRITST